MRLCTEKSYKQCDDYASEWMCVVCVWYYSMHIAHCTLHTSHFLMGATEIISSNDSNWIVCNSNFAKSQVSIICGKK